MTVTALLGGPEGPCQAQIKCAIEITKRLKIRLKGLTLMPDPAATVIYFASSEAIMAGAPGIAAVAEAQDKAAAAFKALFESQTDQAAWLEADYQTLTGNMQAHAAAEAALCDALVFPRGSASADHALNPAFEHVLMEARLPLILASGDGKIDGPPIIAWDGSPQAARAVRFHLPLLQAYEKVIIAQHPGKLREARKACASTAPGALKDWLGEARIEATLETFDGAVDEGLLQIAASHGSGLVVMGAYGHSRMGEMLFGGTSRALLNASEGPALAMAH